jgi:hypothetical protein
VARVTKRLLKSIVKECLIEILKEGIPGIETTTSVQPQKLVTERARVLQKNHASDQIKFESAVEQTVGGLTSDPIMASIFADTAKTTLQEQYNADQSHTVAPAADNSLFSSAPENDPEEIFGEAASNWATLAFTGKKIGR